MVSRSEFDAFWARVDDVLAEVDAMRAAQALADGDITSVVADGEGCPPEGDAGTVGEAA